MALVLDIVRLELQIPVDRPVHACGEGLIVVGAKANV